MAANIHTHNFHNAVTLVWGSLRLTPIKHQRVVCREGLWKTVGWVVVGV